MKQAEAPDETSDHRADETVGDFYTELPEIGIEDVEFLHAQPAHIKLAQQAVYFIDGPFRAASLEREREYREAITVYLLPKSDHTHVLLIRSGTKDDGNGRTFYVAQHADLLEEIPRLVESYGFELTSIDGRYLHEQLPDELTEPFDSDDGDDLYTPTV